MSENKEIKEAEKTETPKTEEKKPEKKKKKGRKRRIIKRIIWLIVILAILGGIGYVVYTKLRADYKVTYDPYRYYGQHIQFAVLYRQYAADRQRHLYGSCGNKGAGD